MDLLEEGSDIYKMTGPILVKQTVAQSKSNIDGRLEYLNKEIKKLEIMIKENEAKQISKRQKIQKL